MEYIALDAHGAYSFVSVESREDGHITETRIEHRPGAIAAFLANRRPGTPVAMETVGNWYWIADEIERAGMNLRLVHAYRAKMMIAGTGKTDRLDARGLNRLQRTGTLPTVWIPPADVRDRRSLVRTRTTFSRQRSRCKQEIHAMLARHGLGVRGSSSPFTKKGRRELEAFLPQLPGHTRFSMERLLEHLDFLCAGIARLDARMDALFADDPRMHLLRTLPSIGPVLAGVILSEVGDIHRFPSPGRFLSYCGLVPRVSSSGGRPVSDGVGPTSTDFSSGPSRRRRTASPRTGGCIPSGTWCGCTSACGRNGAIGSPWGPWHVTSRRRPAGCSSVASSIRIHRSAASFAWRGERGTLS